MSCEKVVSGAVASILQKGIHHHEVEGRLGSVCEGKFIPGVDPDWFEALAKRMKLNKEWSAWQDWTQSEDFYFTVDGVSVRQHRICDPKTCTIRLRTETKKTLNWSLRTLPTCDTSSLLYSGGNVVKIAHAFETPFDRPLPQIVEPTHVRIKQRCYFELASSSIPGSAWRFDLTRVWCGKNSEEAEHKQHNEKPCCEVEIEWKPGTALSHLVLTGKASVDSVGSSVVDSIVRKFEAMSLDMP